jgi:redox-sensitive bicupin YhaK (pirin superfamily)
MLARQLQQPIREIVYRTRGLTHGPITRLMSPGDLGELLKPFVFLDLFVMDGEIALPPIEMGWHPHSGIATVSVILEGAVRYAETTGKQGVLQAGSIEWMRAGSGVWHTGSVEPGRVKGFQLWVALPPELENEPNASHYVMPELVPPEGPARVILGRYGGARSPIDSPPMSYLSVNLKDGEQWTYHPPTGHTVAFVAVHEGTLLTPAPVPRGEIAVFEPSERPIEFVADGATGFVLGSAAKHRHDLALGNYSVHTSAEALRQGEAEIRRIGRELRADGTLRRSPVMLDGPSKAREVS